DDALLLCFLADQFQRLPQAFEIVVAHAGLCSNHREKPYGPFRVRRIALRQAQAGDGEQKRCEHDDLYFLWIIHLRLLSVWLLLSCRLATDPGGETGWLIPHRCVSPDDDRLARNMQAKPRSICNDLLRRLELGLRFRREFSRADNLYC